ncbi:TIGR03749 family integrating conjugative element protein, partial [Halorhodospira halophila]|uniref:TIGR03749 family integrating conjugative element protein n=1 Tax=Halorhodospira halophila TaxID=1053 RepID=UPI001912FCC5|nr:integrating conjugative element protein [Halorhodospira halophila]
MRARTLASALILALAPTYAVAGDDGFSLPVPEFTTDPETEQRPEGASEDGSGASGAAQQQDGEAPGVDGPEPGSDAAGTVATPKKRAAQDGAAPERVVWDGTPIRVILPVDGERIVRLPADQARVGVPPALEDRLRVLSREGVLYLQPTEAFEATRVLVEEPHTGRSFMLDLEAREDGPRRELIVHGEEREAAADPEGPSEAESADGQAPVLDYVTLTRYAAQNLYAPDRLRPGHPGIRSVGVEDGTVALVRGAHVEAEPVAAWRGGGYHVTAVRLTNQTREPVLLDPRALRGDWLAATFQHA